LPSAALWAQLEPVTRRRKIGHSQLNGVTMGIYLVRYDLLSYQIALKKNRGSSFIYTSAPKGDMSVNSEQAGEEHDHNLG
jgi:hypothetical protein